MPTDLDIFVGKFSFSDGATTAEDGCVSRCFGEATDTKQDWRVVSASLMKQVLQAFQLAIVVTTWLCRSPLVLMKHVASQFEGVHDF